MVGLTPEDGGKFPSELSGGMTKRVALARALALDPAIVFLDEPTSGLDPIAAGDFDDLIRTLQETLGLTVFMVTHDLASLNTVCDRVAALADGKDRCDRFDGRAASLRSPVGQGLLSWQALFDAATGIELNQWKRVLPLSSSAPSYWRPSARCSDSCIGCTTLPEPACGLFIMFSSMDRSRDCWSVRRYCSTESASAR